MESQTPPQAASKAVYMGLLLICMHEISAVSSWSNTGQQTSFSWNQRPSYIQQYQRTQNSVSPWRNRGYQSQSNYNKPTTPQPTYYRNALANTQRSAYPYYQSSSYGFPQQRQQPWRQPMFPAYLPPMNVYRQANRLEPFLPRATGDRNIPLTPSVMRMLGISPHGHMMNRMGMNQPYGPDRTVGGITVDGSDISYA